MGENLQLFLCNRKLAREEYKSLMSEGYKELKRTCPLCTTLYMKKLNICIENIYYMIYNI